MILHGLGELIGSGVAGLTYDESGAANVVVGFVPDLPGQCVAILPNGGLEADSKLPYDSPAVQIIVRGDDDPQWALTTWYLIHSFIHGKRNITLPDGTYLVSCLSMQAGPIHLGKDKNGRFMYSMNLQCEIVNTTSERT